MAIKNEVTVNGKKLVRVSQNRTYAYAIVARGTEGDKRGGKSNDGFATAGFYALSWSSRLDLANKAADNFRNESTVDGIPNHEDVTIVKVGDSVTIGTKFTNELSQNVCGKTISRPSNRKLAGVVEFQQNGWKDLHGEHAAPAPQFRYYICEKAALAEVARLEAEDQAVCLDRGESVPLSVKGPGQRFYMAKTGLKTYKFARFVTTLSEGK